MCNVDLTRPYQHPCDLDKRILYNYNLMNLRRECTLIHTTVHGLRSQTMIISPPTGQRSINYALQIRRYLRVSISKQQMLSTLTFTPVFTFAAPSVMEGTIGHNLAVSLNITSKPIRVLAVLYSILFPLICFHGSGRG